MTQHAGARPTLYLNQGTTERPEWVKVGDLATIPDGTPLYTDRQAAGTYEALLRLATLRGLERLRTAGRWLWALWPRLEAWADGDPPPRSRITRRPRPRVQLLRGNEIAWTYLVLAEDDEEALRLLEEAGACLGRRGEIDERGMITTSIEWVTEYRGEWEITLHKRPARARPVEYLDPEGHLVIVRHP